MSWTYNLHGNPDSPLGVMTVVKDDDPGHILVIEREHDPGVCDGYFIRHQDHDAHTAAYDWVACGTPELVIPRLVDRATEKGAPGSSGARPLPAHGVQRMKITESAAMETARQTWPEAEGFLTAPGGWTFRVGAGYAWITDTGHVAEHPQGTRRDALLFMSKGAPGSS